VKIFVLGTRGFPNVQGGVETHCEQLYPRIVKSGNEVTVLTRKSYIPKANRLDQYNEVKFKHLFSPKKKSLEAIIHSILGVIYARVKSPEILHIHAVGPSLVVPFAKLLGLKVVVTNHGPDYDRAKWGKLAKAIIKKGEKFGSKYADKVIVISNVIKNIIKNKYKREDTVLIYNGVIIPEKSDKIDYLSELGITKDKYLFTAGRFVEEKGFHDLINAFAKLKDNKVKLVIAGDADHESTYSKKLKKMAKDNNVILTGFIKGEKLHQLFSHSRLFILPSYHEGLPIALLEAMSYNLNVLVSDIPANAEVDLDKEDYFQTANVDDLAKKLEYKIQHPTIRNFRQIIEEKYNWDKIAEQTIEVYEMVLKGK